MPSIDRDDSDVMSDSISDDVSNIEDPDKR
jgi:hypothetical protein